VLVYMVGVELTCERIAFCNELRTATAKTSRHAGQCEFASETNAAVLRSS
jgi:hypothetical protein